MSITLYKRVCGNCTLRNEEEYCNMAEHQREDTELACFRLNEETFKDRGFVDGSTKEVLTMDPTEWENKHR